VTQNGRSTFLHPPDRFQRLESRILSLCLIANWKQSFLKNTAAGTAIAAGFLNRGVFRFSTSFNRLETPTSQGVREPKYLLRQRPIMTSGRCNGYTRLLSSSYRRLGVVSNSVAFRPCHMDRSTEPPTGDVLPKTRMVAVVFSYHSSH
jgi:hypothetical protein